MSWQAILDSRGATWLDANASECSFGNAVAELAAGADGESVAMPLTHLAIVQVTGDDAVDFLHGQFTNDVSRLNADTAQRSAYCTAKGRMLANFILWKADGSVWLALSADLVPAFVKRLSMFVLRSRVKVSAPPWLAFGAAGKGAAAVVQPLFDDLPRHDMGVLVRDGRHLLRLSEDRYLIASDTDQAGTVWDQLTTHAKAAGTGVWRWLDIRAGMPLVTLPTQEHYVPQMANMELIGAVSFQKGCYPGQEIVARTQYLGKVKRRLYIAHVAGGTLPLPAQDLFSPDLADQACGSVVNAAPAPGGGTDVLAVVFQSSVAANTVRLGSSDGPQLRFLPMPYDVT